MTSKKSMKSAFESMMFVWGQPLEVKTAADVCGISKQEAYACFKELQEEYEQEGRGLRVREVNGAFQFVTLQDNADYIERLCTPVKTKRLSQSALEVLAIIAYKQPVTKGEIEAIRGIKCDRVIEGLAKKELVAEVGRSNAIGRPILYGTRTHRCRQKGQILRHSYSPRRGIQTSYFSICFPRFAGRRGRTVAESKRGHWPSNRFRSDECGANPAFSRC